MQAKGVVIAVHLQKPTVQTWNRKHTEVCGALTVEFCWHCKKFGLQVTKVMVLAINI